MDKEKIIEKILNGEKLTDSPELLAWVELAEENRQEYIRYTNLRALMQRGKEMDDEQIRDGMRRVKAKTNRAHRSFSFKQILKYAAIIILGLMAGYFIHPHTLNQKIAMTEISVPKGNRTYLTLPDGSNVWLTNGSKLIYPERFNGKTRDVQLMGEAFFTVAHNAKKPFMVNVGQHRIRVLGTEFSLVAYPDDNEIQVDLLSGKVEMEVNLGDGTDNYKSAALEPLHSLVLDKTSRKLSRSKIQDDFLNYWRKGMYQFQDESFLSLTKKINRIFGVELIFEDELLKNRTFTGTFNIDDNIYTMMEVFKQASGEAFDYRVDRNKIYLKSIK
ncbi:FecR family protein [Saccharicrinis carchari]|uniref:FecR family protein n=1 Tax=Saccharicrinis carchari TaxID=1168039 RepID=A0A521ABN2_SACCC|nr:FecR domain-containing protein [Saccharicrinis carchari]SMO32196.1 FecR family protein [Saccharicrinis carchari]